MNHRILRYRYIVLLIVAGALVNTVAHAQVRRIIVDKAPAFLYADSVASQLHLFTAGVDMDSDGNFEPVAGDVSSRWFVIDPVTEMVIDSVTFNGFFNAFPVRPGIDAKRGSFYLPQLGHVSEWGMRDRQLRRAVVVDLAASAVTCDTLMNRLILPLSVDALDSGRVLVIDAASAQPIALTPAGVNPTMAYTPPQQFNATVAYAINQGASPTNESTISYVAVVDDIYKELHDQSLQGGAAYLLTSDLYTVIALNGRRLVHVLDASTGRDLAWSPLSVGTGFGPVGPRALAFDGDSILLVGTFAGELFRFRLDDGTPIDTLDSLGRITEVAMRDSLAYLAYRQPGNNNVPDTVVAIVETHSMTVIDSIITPRDPTTLFFDTAGRVHILGFGSGEPWWIRVDAATGTQQTHLLLEGAVNDPLQVAYVATNDSLYVIVADTLRAYSASNPQGGYRVIFTSPDSLRGINAVRYGNDYLIVTEPARSDSAGNSTIHILDRGGNAVARFRGGTRPTMTAAAYGQKGAAFYELDRGTPGVQSSQLNFFAFQTNILDSQALGNGAVFIEGSGQSAGITLYGSHRLVGVNLYEGELSKAYDIGTSGDGGPRQSLIHSDSILLIPTYTGDIRVLRRDSSMRIFPVGGRAEALAVIGDKAFVALVAQNGSSIADSAVAVLDIAPLVSSIRRTSHIASELHLRQNRPNPASGITTVEFALPHAAHVTIDIYSTDGRQVAVLLDRYMEQGEWSVQLDSDRLAPGIYVYRLRDGTDSQSRVMHVVR